MRVRPLPVTDRVDRAGEAVVLVGRTVVRISPLATRVLDLCAGWTDVGLLAEQLVAELGPPPDGTDAREAVESAAADLVDRGLLERG